MTLLIHSQTSTVATVKVWDWISNFIPHFTGHVIYLSMLSFKLTHVNKRGPVSLRPKHDDVINGNIFRVTGHLRVEFTGHR